MTKYPKSGFGWSLMSTGYAFFTWVCSGLPSWVNVNAEITLFRWTSFLSSWKFCGFLLLWQITVRSKYIPLDMLLVLGFSKIKVSEESKTLQKPFFLNFNLGRMDNACSHSCIAGNRSNSCTIRKSFTFSLCRPTWDIWSRTLGKVTLRRPSVPQQWSLCLQVAKAQGMNIFPKLNL